MTANPSRILTILRELSPLTKIDILTDDADRAAISRVRRLSAEVALAAKGYMTS